jgi:oxygen-independent coproporphyrinogen-3 oxidase
MRPFSLDSAQRASYLRFSGLALPRYTSYPAIPHWRDQISLAEKADSLSSYLREAQRFSLYLHVPYCHQLCFYCGCQKEILNPASSAAQQQVERYLDGVEAELSALAPHFKRGYLAQIHVGGGTPNFLNLRQWSRLEASLRKYFLTTEDLSWSLEVDPRTLRFDLLEGLVGLGVTRLSLGVQDFDERVQRAIHRLQPYETVAQLCKKARALGLKSLNFDLIYGLPFQTLASIDRTLDQVLVLRPERIAYYRLAVLPELFVAQKNFAREDLPAGEDSLALNLRIQSRLLAEGYQSIGLDHFALPEDELSHAARGGRLQRNFQGMTTGRDLPLLGIGPSAISSMGDISLQNPKTTKEWLAALKQPETPLRAHRLTADDRLRKAVIDQIFCQASIDVGALKAEFGEPARAMIEHLRLDLLALEKEGLISLAKPERIELQEPLGRLLQRVLASLFDAYLPSGSYRHGLAEGRASSVG